MAVFGAMASTTLNRTGCPPNDHYFLPQKMTITSLIMVIQTSFKTVGLRILPYTQKYQFQKDQKNI